MAVQAYFLALYQEKMQASQSPQAKHRSSHCYYWCPILQKSSHGDQGTGRQESSLHLEWDVLLTSLAAENSVFDLFDSASYHHLGPSVSATPSCLSPVLQAAAGTTPGTSRASRNTGSSAQTARS